MNTSYLINLIENKHFILPNINNFGFKDEDRNIYAKETHQPNNNYQFNENFEQQMYQSAASKHYEDLSIIINKLTKGIVLQTFERQILADYSFILKDEPQKSLQKLNRAKIKIDKILNLK